MFLWQCPGPGPVSQYPHIISSRMQPIEAQQCHEWGYVCDLISTSLGGCKPVRPEGLLRAPCGVAAAPSAAALHWQSAPPMSVEEHSASEVTMKLAFSKHLQQTLPQNLSPSVESGDLRALTRGLGRHPCSRTLPLVATQRWLSAARSPLQKRKIGPSTMSQATNPQPSEVDAG